MNKNSQYVKNSVENLRAYAKLHGLKLVFRNVTTNAGDFCFFIYAPKWRGYNTRYLVGYDGSWNVDPRDTISFDSCWNAAHKFISNYDK
jgi:hypothetical protein